MEPDSPTPSSDDPPAGGSSVGIAVIGVVIGLLVAGAVLWSTRSHDDPQAAAPTTAPAPAPSSDPGADTEAEAAARNAAAVDLVVAYGRSRTEDHALTGELRRPGQDALPVRRAISADRQIDEVGATAAVTEDGESRQCELIDGQWLCAPPLPAISAEMDTQGFATLFLTETPTYSVFDTSPIPPDELSSLDELGAVTCWSFVSDGRVDRSRFGAETTLCFHDEIGALVGRLTETSAGKDLFIADTLRADVTQADVEPSR